MQVCWLVPDVRTAIDSWVQSAGVGPFFWFNGVNFTDGRYRGEPAEFPRVTAAMAQAGEMQIELVSQDNDDIGIFRDLFGRGEFGLHHMALVCKDYQAERDAYIEGGAALAWEGVTGTSRTSWVDTSPTLGFMVELLEPSASRQAWFSHMRDAAESWDGRKPFVVVS
jgi:hypothetical protein